MSVRERPQVEALSRELMRMRWARVKVVDPEVSVGDVTKAVVSTYGAKEGPLAKPGGVTLMVDVMGRMLRVQDVDRAELKQVLDGLGLECDVTVEIGVALTDAVAQQSERGGDRG